MPNCVTRKYTDGSCLARTIHDWQTVLMRDMDGRGCRECQKLLEELVERAKISADGKMLGVFDRG